MSDRVNILSHPQTLPTNRQEGIFVLRQHGQRNLLSTKENDQTERNYQGTEVLGNPRGQLRGHSFIGRSRVMAADTPPSAANPFLSLHFQTPTIHAPLGGLSKGGRSLCLLLNFLSLSRYRNVIKAPD